jgi:hypothetical protein
MFVDASADGRASQVVARSIAQQKKLLQFTAIVCIDSDATFLRSSRCLDVLAAASLSQP